MLRRLIIASPLALAAVLTGCEPPEPATTWADVAPLLAAADTDPALRAPLVTRGAQQFRQLGCTTCHRFNQGMAAGPALGGLIGRRVALLRPPAATADGTRADRLPPARWDEVEAVIDRPYLYESITRPRAALVKGYEAGTQMSWFGWLPAGDVAALIAYLESQPGPGTAAGGPRR